MPEQDSIPRFPAKTQRDIRIDFLRGLTICFMLFEHLPNSCFNHLVPFSLSFSQCRDVFILLSGYVSAIAFGKIYVQKGLRACCRRVLRRCAQLYIWNLVTLAIVALIVFTAGAGRLLAPLPSRPILAGIALLWKPGYFDILTVYMVWLAAVPFILYFLKKNPVIVMAGSLLLYGVAQFHPGLLGQLLPPLATNWLEPLAWQILFCLGMWLGFRKLNGLLLPRLSRVFVGVAAASVAFGTGYRVVRLLLKHDAWDVAERLGLAQVALPLPDGFVLSPIRLIWFGAAVILALRFRSIFHVNIQHWIVKGLVICGQHSLNLYCIHTVLVYAASIIAAVDNSLPMQIAVGLVSLAIMVTAAFAMQRYREFSTAGRKLNFAPAGARV